MDINPCGCSGNPIIDNYKEKLFNIKCTDCGIATVLCYDVETAIEKWNIANPIKYDIDNAVQAVLWLSNGERLTTPDDDSIEYVCREFQGTKILVKYKQNISTVPFGVFDKVLLKYKWELDVHSSFKHSFEEAILAMLDNKLVSTYLDGELYYIHSFTSNYIDLRVGSTLYKENIKKVCIRVYSHSSEYEQLKQNKWSI